MPRDKRLWMTFPIDMHRHPKVTRLPLSARWAFFEMNGEARIDDNDGIFPAVEAEHQWGKKILDQLVSSHPTRPLVVRDGDVYRIREFAEHQETRADREARVERNAKNGKLGGRPRKNPVGSESVSGGNPVGSDSLAAGNRTVTHGNPESESESETDTYKTSQSSHVGNRASNAIDSTDPDLIHVSRYGIDIPAVIAKVEAVYGQTPNERALKQMADAVFGSAKNPKNPTAVLLTSVERDGKEWRAALAGEQVKR